MPHHKEIAEAIYAAYQHTRPVSDETVQYFSDAFGVDAVATLQAQEDSDEFQTVIDYLVFPGPEIQSYLEPVLAQFDGEIISDKTTMSFLEQMPLTARLSVADQPVVIDIPPDILTSVTTRLGLAHGPDKHISDLMGSAIPSSEIYECRITLRNIARIHGNAIWGFCEPALTRVPWAIERSCDLINTTGTLFLKFGKNTSLEIALARGERHIRKSLETAQRQSEALAGQSMEYLMSQGQTQLAVNIPECTGLLFHIQTLSRYITGNASTAFRPADQGVSVSLPKGVLPPLP